MNFANLPLQDIPSPEWREEFETLLKHPYIQKKYNRPWRLGQKTKYIDEHLPEVKKTGYVLDIGPGPGEFLEICRAYGNKILGIDAKVEESMMGYPYCRLSKMMTQRQKVPVLYENFESYLEEERRLPIEDGVLTVINSQGALEQVFRKHIKHPPSPGDGSATVSHKGIWKVSRQLITQFQFMFEEFKRTLVKGGVIFWYGNGSNNPLTYHNLVKDTAHMNGFRIVATDERQRHKMRKMT